MKPIVATPSSLTASPLLPAAEPPGLGRVIAVYPPEYTTAFRAARHLPAESGPSGRFAIVQVDAAKTSYALIYVPADVHVARDTVVEIRST